MNCILLKIKDYSANTVDPAVSSGSAVFANSAIVVFGALRAKTMN